MIIRELKKEDREQINQIIVETNFFTAEEVAVAMELIDIYLNNPDQKDYYLFSAIDDSGVLGYICIGPTPLTDGTYDLYWIVVKSSEQNKGLGKVLMNYAEEFVKNNKGRLLVAETSSQEKYKSTCQFYLRAGYEQLVKIKDYYKIGDDLLVYGKYL